MTAVFGVFGRTGERRAQLAARFAALIPKSFPAPADARWWQGPGIALHAPSLSKTVRDGADLVLASTAASAADFPPTLESLAKVGTKALLDARGEFALAFWNGETEELLLARDHFGQRRLFVRDEGDLVYFATDLAPLLRIRFYPQRLDFESAFHFLAFGTPMPGRTLARDIASLPAAHALLISTRATSRKWRYYSPISFHAAKVPDERQTSEIASLLDRSILDKAGPGRKALLLSAGVDSSYIAATIGAEQAADELDAYTIRFPDVPFVDESEAARTVADSLSIKHATIDLSTTEAVNGLDAVLGASEPCSAWASITHRHLMRAIADDGHTRLLSGLGADEVFGGYFRYLEFYRRFRQFQARHRAQDAVDAYDAIMWRRGDVRARLFSGIPRFLEDASLREALSAPFGRWDAKSLVSAFYRECRSEKSYAHAFELMIAHECQHRIPDLLLAGFEPFGLAEGITTVYPFLDPDVVTLACGLGAADRFWEHEGRWRNKRLLRRIASRRLPAELLLRLPTSYSAPIEHWLTCPAFSDRILAVLDASQLANIGLLEVKWLSRLRLQAEALRASECPSSDPVLTKHLWIVTVLSVWFDTWLPAPETMSSRELASAVG